MLQEIWMTTGFGGLLRRHPNHRHLGMMLGTNERFKNFYSPFPLFSIQSKMPLLDISMQVIECLHVQNEWKIHLGRPKTTDRNKPGREKVRLAQVLVLSRSVGISLNL